MPTLKDMKNYTDRAAATYKDFKFRTEMNLLLTRHEKVDRLRDFLDAHVGIFDDYFKAWDDTQAQRQQKGKTVQTSDGLSPDAKEMAEDIASIFTDSETRKFYNTHNEGRGADLQNRFLAHRRDILLSGDHTRRDSIVSYADAARENFRKQEQGTLKKYNPMQLRAMDAQARVDELQERADRARKLAAQSEA